MILRRSYTRHKIRGVSPPSPGSGGFRGVSVVSIETPFVPDNLVIKSKICHSSRSQYEPGEALGLQWKLLPR